MTKATATAEQAPAFDAYAPDRVHETALRMLRRYSTVKVAREMAFFHGIGHPDGSRERAYWLAVDVRIMELAKARQLT